MRKCGFGVYKCGTIAIYVAWHTFGKLRTYDCVFWFCAINAINHLNIGTLRAGRQLCDIVCERQFHLKCYTKIIQIKSALTPRIATGIFLY